MRGPTRSERQFATTPLLAGASLLACAGASPPVPVTVVIEEPAAPPPGTDPLTPGQRLLALLRDDNPRLERVAMSLAGVGDRMALLAAGRRLVALARAIGSPAWEEAERGRAVAETDQGAGLPSMEARAAQASTRLLAAMSHVGGPAVIAYCFEVAEDEAAPLDRRRLAVRVLERVLARDDEAERARLLRIVSRLPAPIASGVGLRTSGVMLYLRQAFRACYVRALEQDPALQVKVRLTLRTGRDGQTESEIEGSPAAGELARCLDSAAKGIRSVDRTEVAPEITIPFMFVPSR